MKTLRWIAPVLALVLLITPGCILTSGQITIEFELGVITVTSSTSIESEDVDLNTISEYADHKSDLKGLADVAALGSFVNLGPDVGVELWMTPALTAYTTEALLKADATAKMLWGPFNVPTATTKTVDWDESARLFSAAGKAALITEVTGDGIFTVYAIGNVGVYSFRVDNGSLVLVLDAAQ